VTTFRELRHLVERTVVIEARRETVFSFFTDPKRWASWWGAGSTIDASPRGRVLIRHPDATEVCGEVIDIFIPERIVFTYGNTSGHPIPPGGSVVTIRLTDEGAHTRLHLIHAFKDLEIRDQSIQGWRFQLSLFANVVANEVHAGADAVVDAWFNAWSEPDPTVRKATLTRVAAPDVRFRDRFSFIDGVAELLVHLDAASRFMPGIRLQREGEIRHCQGVVLADWTARASNGEERSRGTNVFVLNSNGYIESVTGFWSQHPNS
jgi:uncharacterized protein YndB with AHSA1/START domain